MTISALHLAIPAPAPAPAKPLTREQGHKLVDAATGAVEAAFARRGIELGPNDLDRLDDFLDKLLERQQGEQGAARWNDKFTTQAGDLVPVEG